MDVPPNSAGSERAKEFVRLAEALLWPTVVEKAKDGFFDGLLRERRGPHSREGKKTVWNLLNKVYAYSYKPPTPQPSQPV